MYKINLPSQSVADALTRLSQQLDIQVLFPYELAVNQTSGAVSGEYSLAQLLELLLDGTGLTGSLTSGGVLMVHARTEEGGKPEPEIAQVASEALEAEADRGDSLIIEEVLVTAQKREQRISDVPLAIQGFSGNNLDYRGVRSIEELISLVPGGSIPSGGVPNTPTIQIRGIGGTVRGEPATAVYLDEHAYWVPDVPFSPPVNVFDLERVEVLRGPQGTLYGFGAMGGTVKLITKDPDISGGFSGKARLWGADISSGTDSHGVDVAANIPLIADTVAARLTYSKEKLGGYIDDLSGNRNVNQTEFTNIRGKLTFEPNERFAVKLSLWSSQVENKYSNLLFDTDPDRTFFSAGTFFDTEFQDYGLSLFYDLGFARIESSTSYLDYRNAFEFSAEGLFQASDDEVYNLVNETRLVSTGKGSFHWIAGVLYTDAEVDGDGVTDVFGAIRNSDDGISSTESFAVFGELSVDLMEGKLTPLVGLRYFEDKRLRETDLISTLPGVAPIVNSVALKDTFETINPRFNLTYRPAEDSLVYLNIAKGSRSGSFPAPNDQNQLLLYGVEPVLSINPDKLWSYEVGGKWQLLGGNLQMDLTAYYMDWSDLHGSVTTPSGTSGILLNTGDAEIYGLEYNLAYHTAIDGLVLQLTGNTNRAEISDEDSALVEIIESGGGSTNLTDGTRLSGTPAFSYTFAVDYRRPFYGESELSLYLSYTRRAEQLDVDTTLRVDALENLRIRGTVSRDNWGVTLFANNLLNENGVATGLNDGAFLSRITPREVGVELNYSWGG